MADIIHWPADLLKPESALASKAAFTRSGGRSLGGLQRSVKTDRGFWRHTLTNISLRSPDMRRTWNAIGTDLGGTAGLVAIPAWSFDSAPFVGRDCIVPRLIDVPHDDETPFDDDALYEQGNILLEMAAFAPLGSTVVTLRAVHSDVPSGIRFSYQHALYETGRIISQPTGNTYQVAIFPAIRAPIPANSILEADRPTCLCRLAADTGMDLQLSSGEIDTATVDFVEAVDHWSDLALGMVG